MPPSPTFADLEIRILTQRAPGYRVDLTLNGSQQLASGVLDASILSWTPTADPDADGQALFDRLLAGPELRTAWGEARGQQAQRRIRLVIDPTEPQLHTLPWELLREPGDAYGLAPAIALAASSSTPFSRYLEHSRQPPPAIDRRPVRILAVIASPEGLAAYDLQTVEVDQEWASLRQAAESPQMALTLLPPPCTLQAIEAELRQGYHVLHFVGHGAFVRPSGQAVLFLADQANQVQLANDAEIAAMLARLMGDDNGQLLRLVFLASCETATRSPADAYRGLAPQLVRAGAAAVVAMQDLAPVETARQFAATFYRQLLEHGLVDLACNQARATVLTARLPGAAIPVLFSRLQDNRLLEILTGDRRPAIERKPFEPETILVPAGPFLMGSADPAAPAAERDQHTVVLPDFRIGRYPVTVRQYAAFLRDRKDQPAPQGWFNREPPAGLLEHPVTNVSWFDALAYCAWLREQTGRRYTLPSEAEWEKAASWGGGQGEGGKQVDKGGKQRYPWGDEWVEGRCNAAGSGTTAVTAHPDGASAYSVEDLLGNVQEWTRSLWGSQPQQPSYGYPYDPNDGREVAEAEDLPAQARLVHRGGSFKSQPADLRCSARGNFTPDSRIAWRGFRVALMIA